MTAKRPIINIDELELRGWGHGGIPASVAGASKPREEYQAQLGAIGSRIGAKGLGYNLTVVQPGKKAFPFHSHHGNEEMYFIIAGRGEVRLGEARYPIRAGDVIACPAGGPETAHQVINNSDAELKYLIVSTKNSPDVADYPDSDKFGVYVDLGQTPEGRPNFQRVIGRWKHSVGYWEDE